MADGRSFHPPKPQPLTENETITSFADWKSNIEYHLSLNHEFAPFLGSEWSKKFVINRGLQNAPETIAEDVRKTAIQKNIVLEHMLGLVAQFAPPLLRNDSLKKSTSLSWIWARIRKHYSFTKSEANFLKLHNITCLENECYETFFQRIMSHLEDSLLTAGSDIQHDGAAVTVDKEMSPTCERLGVYLWLTLIDSHLPPYVSRIYGHELQSRSLKDLQPQLADTMDSMLQVISAQENIQVQYSRSYQQHRSRPTSSRKATYADASPKKVKFPDDKPKQCLLCKAAGRKYVGHSIGSCWFLSKFDKLSIARSVKVKDEFEESQDNMDIQFEHNVKHTLADPAVSIKKVQCGVSPFFYAFYKHCPCHIIVDSGATSSLVSRSFLNQAGIKIQPTHQSAHGIDKSPLGVRGEVKLNLNFGELTLPITALVVDSLDCDILSGIPFCRENDIEIHLKSEEISVMGQHIP